MGPEVVQRPLRERYETNCGGLRIVHIRRARVPVRLIYQPLLDEGLEGWHEKIVVEVVVIVVPGGCIHKQMWLLQMPPDH